MSDATDDLVCPECGGPIGTTSTYCMHCSADLSERSEADAPDRSGWAGAATAVEDPFEETVADDEPVATPQDLPPELRSSRSGLETPRILPEDFLLKAVTFVLAMVAGFVVGLGGAVALAGAIANDLAFVGGVVVWFAVTAAILRVVPG